MTVPTAEELRRLERRKPKDLDDARKRYQKWRRHDPFPEITPGLLHCAAFCDYAVTTGLLYPFNISPRTIKLAGYDFDLLGDVVYWDANGDRHDPRLTRGDRFTLQRNSIAFVTLEPYLQLPDYIALRFNLRVTNVYRGLLLGTGPLVDPGYQGNLSIPLHNLTNNDYTFEGGEGLISVEFTKLTRFTDVWEQHPPHGGKRPRSRSGLYIPFPEPTIADPSRTDRNVSSNLKKADPQRSIQSSLPPTIARLEAAAEKAQRTLEVGTVFAVTGALLAALALGGAIYDAHSHADSVTRQVSERLEADDSSRVSLDGRLRRLEASEQDLQTQLVNLRDSLRNRR